MGGNQIHGHGTGDDGFDEDGYDESQRAEILEVTRDGPTDGIVIVDLDPDMGEEDSTEDEDDLAMEDGEIGEDDDIDEDEDDIEEDDVQAAFDEDGAADDELDDRNDAALRP